MFSLFSLTLMTCLHSLDIELLHSALKNFFPFISSKRILQYMSQNTVYLTFRTLLNESRKMSFIADYFWTFPQNLLRNQKQLLLVSLEILQLKLKYPSLCLQFRNSPVPIYLFKVNKDARMTSDIALQYSSLTLNIFHTLLQCFHC